MQRCRNCGSGNEDDSLYCQDCGEPLATRDPVPVDPEPEPARGETTQTRVIEPASSGPRLGASFRQFERPAAADGALDGEFSGAPPAPGVTSRTLVPTIPGTTIVLSEGERLWRAYPLLHFRPFRWRARGTLFVTDSRLLLHSSALKFTGRTTLLQEVRLESVTGFGSYIDRGLGALGFLFALLATIAGIEEIVNGSTLYGIVLLVIVALVAYISYRYGRLGLQVFTSQASVGPINFGRFGAGRLQNLFPALSLVGAVIGGVQATDVLYCFPEANANEVITELGALVFDLNRKGTLEQSAWDAVAPGR